MSEITNKVSEKDSKFFHNRTDLMVILTKVKH
jgi:hypothetical protein